MATDYWKLCETGLIDLLKAELTSYFPNADKQVRASDDSILDNGNDYYAITYPGAFPQTEFASGFIEYSWEILLDVISRWKTTEANAWTAFKAFRADVIYLINHTNAGRNLNKTNYVRQAVLSSEDRPSYIPLQGPEGNQVIYTHVRQVCVVTVQQIVPRDDL